METILNILKEIKDLLKKAEEYKGFLKLLKSLLILLVIYKALIFIGTANNFIVVNFIESKELSNQQEQKKICDNVPTDLQNDCYKKYLRINKLEDYLELCKNFPINIQRHCYNKYFRINTEPRDWKKEESEEENK